MPVSQLKLLIFKCPVLVQLIIQFLYSREKKGNLQPKVQL